MRSLQLKSDGNNQPTSSPMPSDYVQAVLLVANVEQTVTVPAAALDGFVLFSADGQFWARPNATAAIPVANITDGTASVLNPASWALDGVATIHLIADAATKISVSFFKAKP
jgi:hypothetical protein